MALEGLHLDLCPFSVVAKQNLPQLRGYQGRFKELVHLPLKVDNALGESQEPRVVVG